MEKLAETTRLASVTDALLPVSVIVPVRNEAQNLVRCLSSLQGFGELYVIDSQSRDATAAIAAEYGAKVVQFHYGGGWPKKRQWAMDTLPFQHEWIFLVDADEAVPPELAKEILEAVRTPDINGYYVGLQMHFLGRRLNHCGANFYKLSLFRRGMGRFECRFKDQDTSMADMEVHEHVIVDGSISRLKNSLTHYNVESLSRYIQKHDEYSNWDAKLLLHGSASTPDLPAALFATQAQRRRWLRKWLFNFPGSPLMFFLYKYLFRLGFMDGVPGFIYCCFQGIQFFHIKAKVFKDRRTAKMQFSRQS